MQACNKFKLAFENDARLLIVIKIELFSFFLTPAGFLSFPIFRFLTHVARRTRHAEPHYRILRKKEKIDKQFELVKDV